MINKRVISIGLVFISSLIFFLLSFYTLSQINISHAQNIIHVRSDASSVEPDGSTWELAYPDLQEALDVASSGDEIWVAAGTYLPSKNDRTVSFNMKAGVSIFGGFGGTEMLREGRNWKANPTILSGDLEGNDDPSNIIPDEVTRSDNSYHVVKSENLDGSAILDGFTVTGGNTHTTNSGAPLGRYGGGMLNISSSPTIRETIFVSNTAHENGGGMYNVNNSNPVLNNLTFIHNYADNNGGGVSNIHSSPTFSNVLIISNTARYGGGVFNENNASLMSDITFIENVALVHGGGLYNFKSSPQLTYVSFFENVALTNGGGMYNHTGNSQLNKVIFKENTANQDGGGIFNTELSDPQISQTIIVSNSAYYGGGIFSDDGGEIIKHSTISYNNATGNGGGIYNNANNSSITNSTISFNFAGDQGGGIFDRKDSGDRSNTKLNFVTIVSNTAVTNGGGIHDNGGNFVIIKNSILANNLSGDIPSDCYGRLLSHGYNLIENDNLCTVNPETNGGTDIGKDPELQPISPRGEFSLIHPLSETSPAIDNGDCTLIDGSTIMDDQQFFKRPFGQTCDIGAVEWTVFSSVLPAVFHNYTNTQFFEGPYEEEPNDLPPDEVNGPLISGQNYYGRFPSIDDNSDYYSIVLTRAHTIKIWLTDIPVGENYDLTLRDSANINNHLEHSGELGNTSEYIGTGILPAGLYYIQVSNRQNTGNDRYYTLKARFIN